MTRLDGSGSSSESAFGSNDVNSDDENDFDGRTLEEIIRFNSKKQRKHQKEVYANFDFERFEKGN